MLLKTPISQHLIAIKYKVLQSLLITSIVAFIVVAFVNLINQRPLSNFFTPIAFAGFVYSLFFFSQNFKYRKISKLIFMIMLTNIYLPLAWFTSPGSFSAMSFYSVLLIFVSLILAEKIVEYLIPALGLVEMMFLLQYETLHPEQYNLYVPMPIRAFDLSVNFVIVILVFLIISLTLNHYFDDEHQRLFKISITDQLTKLFNRRYLFQKMEETYYVAYSTKRPFSLIMIDINHFKLVNDTYGHAVGDEVLKALAEVLMSSCRKNDIPARFGGDEFIVLLPDTDYEQATMISNRIIEAFRPTAKTYSDIGLSLAVGITQNNDLSIDEMIQVADDHLYKNKRDIKKDESC